MTTEEFDKLTVGDLQRLHAVLTGKPSSSRNKPALRKKLANHPELAEAVAEVASTMAKKAAGVKAKPEKAKPAAKPKAKAAPKDRKVTPEHDATVAIIKGLHKQKLSLREIKAQLEEKGIRTARGGKLWWPSSIQSALGQRW